VRTGWGTHRRCCEVAAVTARRIIRLLTWGITKTAGGDNRRLADGVAWECHGCCRWCSGVDCRRLLVENEKMNMHCGLFGCRQITHRSLNGLGMIFDHSAVLPQAKVELKIYQTLISSRYLEVKNYYIFQ